MTDRSGDPCRGRWPSRAVRTLQRQEARTPKFSRSPAIDARTSARKRGPYGVSYGGTCGWVGRRHAGPGRPTPPTQTVRESHGPPAPEATATKTSSKEYTWPNGSRNARQATNVARRRIAEPVLHDRTTRRSGRARRPSRRRHAVVTQAIRSLSRWRAITMRWISLVPSPISQILASRM